MLLFNKQRLFRINYEQLTRRILSSVLLITKLPKFLILVLIRYVPKYNRDNYPF